MDLTGEWDLVRVEQAISNLLMNALKYSSGKNIYVTIAKDGDFGIVEIKDHGIGIKEEYLATIFEPFKRVTKNNNIEGLGVGLFIARQIAIAHDGDITVKSKERKGSTFTLRLPLSTFN